MIELAEMMREVQKEFPGAECVGYNALQGFCIYWPTEVSPVIATGQRPKKAWKNAYRLIKGKSPKALDKLKRTLVEREAKTGVYGPGA